jgi:hypothetical protein
MHTYLFDVKVERWRVRNEWDRRNAGVDRHHGTPAGVFAVIEKNKDSNHLPLCFRGLRK